MSTGWDYVTPRHDLFSANAHLRHLRVVFDRGVTVERDIPADQRELVIDGLDVTTSTLRFIADQVWSGTVWQDFCLSDIDLDGEPGGAAEARAVVP